MDTELLKGNPHDPNRIARENETYELLDSLGIEYERIDHESAFTIEQCLQIEKLLGTEICKNLFLRNSNSSKYYLLMMPGAKQFKTKVLSSEIGSTRLSFANEDDMMRYLSLTPGSVSVLALAYDKENKVELLIDSEILSLEYLGCHPCINTSSLKIKMSDILCRFLPAVNHNYREVIL